jgi:ABC-type branched-subunit amino acid transport system substrate-binding protein
VVGGVYTETGQVPFTNAMGAAEAFWKNVNDTGGINGYKIDFVDADDAQDANKNAAAVTKLVQSDKAQVIATVAEQTALGGMDIANKAGIPFLGTYSQPKWFQTPGVFTIGAFYQSALAAAVVTEAKKAGFTKIAMVTVNSPTAKIAADYFRPQITNAGMKLVQDIAYEPTQTDFTGPTSLIAQSGADLALCICAQGHIGSFGKSLDLQGYTGVLFATGYSPAYKDQIGSWANGRLWTGAPVAPLGNDQARAAVEAIGKKYNSKLDTSSINFAYSWTQGEMIAEAIRRVGDKPMTAANIQAALESFKDWQGTYDAPLTFGPSAHPDPANCIQLQVVDKTGTLTPVGGERFSCWQGSVAPKS